MNRYLPRNGDEIYFSTGIDVEEENAVEVVGKGTIAVAGSASTVNSCEYTGLAMQYFHKSLKLITMLNI